MIPRTLPWIAAPWTLALPLLLLAGCHLFTPEDNAPKDTRNRACENAADHDPNVQNLLQNHGGSSNLNDFSDEYKAARARSIAKCETTSGGFVRGGVERVR